MKTSFKALSFISVLIMIGLITWWLGPWRIREILVDKKTETGTHYCIVQVYKDFAESGWVIGVYLLEEDEKWRLRSYGRSKTPWKSAKLEDKSGNIVFIAKSETTSIKNTIDISSREMPWEEGWVLPGDYSSRQIQQNLIHSTY
jgi:hypothetical protein